MLDSEVCGQPYKWSYNQLSSILAAHVASGVGHEVNTADRRAGGGGDRLLFTAAFKGCLCCGLDNHLANECTAPPCGFCGLRFCFGARKKGTARECLVKKIVGGGKVTDTDIGFNGRPLPAVLLDRINKKATEMKPKEANAVEVQTEPNVTPYMGENDFIEGADESD